MLWLKSDTSHFSPQLPGQNYLMAQPNCKGAGKYGGTDGVFSEPLASATGMHFPKLNLPVWLSTFTNGY